MSLNGLDHVKVAEAYHSALAEAGGWFLLKYASRDSVEVLTRGTGGAAEARGAIAQYEEKSPLYGFLLYRRRKVLIKYVPEGTTRLLQARVAVHFTAVTEKLTPHDTIISVAAAEELSDAALTSACSLHTAAPSSSSSSGSSKRHKLDEITEDAEEGQSTADDSAPTARPTTATSTVPIIVEPPAEIEAEGVKTTAAPKPELSHVTIEAVTEKQDQQPEPKASNGGDSFKHYDALFEHGPDPRLSSQTARPELSDLYAEIYAQYNKPKVKLGPRPKQSLDIKRPHTSGNGSEAVARPVSSLPPGLRAAKRKTAEPKRPKSRDSSAVPSIAFPPPPPVPAIPDMPSSPSYPPRSPASVRSLPIHSHGSHHHKSSGVTPEKQRLMKALELRKRQMKARKEKEEKTAESPPENADAGAQENAKGAEAPTHDTSPMETVEEEASSAAKRDVAPTPSPIKEEVPSNPEASIMDETKPSLAHEEFGMEGNASQAETDDMHSAASASSPTSAQTQGSSCAPSTRPSSISEDDRQLREDDVKPGNAGKPIDPEEEKLNESSHKEDEEDSIESSPTVVPESATPVPSVQISAQGDQSPVSAPQPSVSDDFLARRSKRESMVLMPPSDGDDARSQRRSNRESMLFMPAPESSQQDETHTRKQKRESMIFTAPVGQIFGESKEKRRPTIDPIHLSAENSEAEYLSDDSFMEELQSATLEEAKPVSVSKSPITPYFSRKASMSEHPLPSRSASQQYVKPGRLSPDQPSSRKSSGPWLTHANTDTTVVMAKKINVSSGISQRIKALAEKSNRDSSASVSPLATPDASTSIVAQRKSSFFSTPPSGNSPNGKPIPRLSRASFANLSNSSTPDKKPVLQPPPTIEPPQQPVYNAQQASVKPESVQVTARIVRDARIQKPTLTMPTENTPLELHQSPIIIDHQRSMRPPSSSKLNSPTRAEPTSPKPPSSSHSREVSTGVPRSSSESSWRSFGRRLSESKSGPPRSLSTHSFESGDEKRETKADKKDSRTSKLFKRMSSISSISRKNSTAGSTLQEEEEFHIASLPSLREPPPAVQVGDLNIQFPDTLLWKRRWVEIDAMGNLVLSLSKSNEQSKGITKRFHLTEFRTPYAPDQDRQELPNSVILDFIDGRTLQCACETYVAQAQVLQILREAHDAWLAYNQGQ